MPEKTQAIIKKLEEIEHRYEGLQKEIADPENATNPQKLISLSRQEGKLRSLVSRYREFRKNEEEIAGSRQIMEDPESSDDFRELASEELIQLEETREKLLSEMLDTLVMADDRSIDSVIIEVRAGTGGDEASLFARDLYQMYTKYAESRRWKTEVLEFRTTEMGGLREAIFSIRGPGVWSQLGYEGGGHRVQRVPETESQGRVHTSAATVAVLPEPEEVDIEIDPADVEEHVSRSSGPGGQSVNKLSSAVRLEHIPTGITVSMQDEKSQHKNRAKAWRILRSRIYDHFESRKRAERDSQRKTMIGSGDRSQKIRTYNFPQNRVTDHRINLSLYALEKIMGGDLSQLVAALIEHDKQQRLKNL